MQEFAGNCTRWRAARGLEEAEVATCPECDAEIEIDEYDVDKGDLLSCPECGANLEVTGTTPIELDLAAEDEDEDEDDVDEDDEEKDEGDWEE